MRSNPIAEFTKNFFILATRGSRDLRHVLGTANWAAREIADPETDVRPIPRIDLWDVCPGSHRWSLQSFPKVGASVSPAECVALAALCRLSRAKRIFEFGTYKGVSTTQLALNVEEGGQVFTLDLPEDHPAYSLPILKEEEREIAAEGGKGMLIPQDLLDRISFLRSDSATFDTDPFLSSIDLCFVDGAHSFEYVENDSRKGWEMLRSGGVLAWHDCTPNHRGVVTYIKGLDRKVQLIGGTSIAYAVKP